jgi:hypothetical protein
VDQAIRIHPQEQADQPVIRSNQVSALDFGQESTPFASHTGISYGTENTSRWKIVPGSVEKVGSGEQILRFDFVSQVYDPNRRIAGRDDRFHYTDVGVFTAKIRATILLFIEQ